MGEYSDREYWDIMKGLSKEEHDKRVADTPRRIEYCQKRFKEENITFILKNKSIGHFHLFDSRKNLFQFWASTGKIYADRQKLVKMGIVFDGEGRGIEKVIKLIKLSNSKVEKSQPLVEKKLDRLVIGNIEVIDAIWFGGCLGIIKTVDTITGELKYYIGNGGGLALQEDIEHIVGMGTKYTHDGISSLLKNFFEVNTNETNKD